MPQTWTSTDGKRSMTAAELAQREIDRARHVSDVREHRRREFRDAARDGIRAALGTTKDGEDYQLHLSNLISRATSLVLSKLEGTITADESVELAALKDGEAAKNAWRAAENAASAALDAAGVDESDTPDVRIAEILAVTATWPS